MPTEPQSNRQRTPEGMTAELAAVIDRWTVGREDCPTPIPQLGFFRRENPSEPCACLLESSVVLVVQGAKQLLIGEEIYAHDSERFLLASLDLPASSQVIEASPERPCLGMSLRLDLRVMTELIALVGMAPPRHSIEDGGAVLGDVTAAMLEPFVRLVATLEEPGAVEVLAPMIVREIHYRLLMSDQAARLLQTVSVGSQTHRMARAIDWLKVNYTRPLRVEALAAHVQMSTSSLHQRFRQLTGMSPLQYQKRLRLDEARRLMLNERLDAAGAAFKVGYESPSQFSREYRRLFGEPPKRDVVGLQQRAEASALAAGNVPKAPTRAAKRPS